MDTLIAAALGVGLFMTHRATAMRDMVRNRKELRNKAGIPLRSLRSAAYWGNNDGSRPAQRMRATFEVDEYPHPLFSRHTRRPKTKLVSKKEALRASMDRVTSMEVPTATNTRGSITYSRKYPPEDARAHALRRVNGRVSALTNPDKYLASRRGEFLLPQK